ncbi:MAG TPA: helix-turn-helix transcriptional regulator [Chitinophagales bacterium]|nr:helix-turn-helix transcriptional regulator [Chitinophagales bacterium]
MQLHERIKQIREYRGLKQITVAHEMGITQQAYSWLETKSGNIKLDTLTRFCNVMKVELPFLMATDIPVTAENLQTFDRLNYSNIFEEYKRLKNRLKNFEEMVLEKAV